LQKIIGNEEIYGYTVVVLDENGHRKGEMIKKAAIMEARNKGLDLIQVAKTEKDIPICKYGDLGKLRFEASKKKTAQKQVETKEMMFHITTNQHDIDVKKNKIRSMLEKGNMVVFGIEMKGRERSFADNARTILESNVIDLKDVADWDDIKTNGGTIYALLKPKKENSHANKN
jgi:translation initiation factor IF-3